MNLLINMWNSWEVMWNVWVDISSSVLVLISEWVIHMVPGRSSVEIWMVNISMNITVWGTMWLNVVL